MMRSVSGNDTPSSPPEGTDGSARRRPVAGRLLPRCCLAESSGVTKAGIERSLERMSRPLCRRSRASTVGIPSGRVRRAWTNRRATEQATRAANARQLSGRRRFVDPTTSEREYYGSRDGIHDGHERVQANGAAGCSRPGARCSKSCRALGYEKVAADDESPAVAAERPASAGWP